jgi:hypothetical protein
MGDPQLHNNKEASVSGKRRSGNARACRRRRACAKGPLRREGWKTSRGDDPRRFPAVPAAAPALLRKNEPRRAQENPSRVMSVDFARDFNDSPYPPAAEGIIATAK